MDDTPGGRSHAGAGIDRSSRARRPCATDAISCHHAAPVLDLALLHRDDRLAAFAKPSGLLVHRGWGDDDIVALDLARRLIGARVHPVHRLDRATSGVLLFALDPESAAAMGGQFAEGAVRKTYVAFVRGVPPEEGVVDSPVPRTEGGSRVPAVTAYRRLAVVEAGEGEGARGVAGLAPADPRPWTAARRFSLVEASPRTGRLHQIRRHLKHLGHPVVGDVNYGKGDVNRLFRERYGLRRLALHAAALSFVHPFTGALTTILAPLPDDLRGPLAALGIPGEVLAGGYFGVAAE
jgi:tRNA pseudouridine65 synthase